MRTRRATVAGSFYPDDPIVLAGTVDGYFADAAPPVAGAPPRALVAPHAGYLYSGPVAASAFARLGGEPRPERVLLLGPSHHVRFAGLALPEADVGAFATPFGPVPLAAVSEARLADLPQVGRDDAPHAREHSIEVELPFLQRRLGAFHLLPLAVGEASDEDVADVIDALADERTLVVVSTDLSHYLPDAVAREHDRQTSAAIECLEPERIGRADACGAVPLRGLLVWARRHGLACRRLDLRNSSDTAGGPERVVGYGAYELA